MPIYVNHDLRVNDGKTIWMPPWSGSQAGYGNLKIPVVNTADDTQLYPIGARLIDGNRVFRYCYAGSNIIYPQRGIANASPHLEGTCLANSVAGEYTLDLPPACADPYGALTYATKDVYAGGWVWVMGLSGEPTDHEFHRILSNDASTGTYVRVTLETPLINSVATPWITSYRNIYANCQQDYPNVPSLKQAIVCMTTGGMTVTEGQYFWGLTWGETWTTAVGHAPGEEDNERELMFWQGGVIHYRHGLDPTNYSRQRAGFVLTNTVNTGDMMFMLQIDR